MKSHVSAIRAVTAEFAQQFVRPFLWIAFGIIFTLIFITGLLAYFVSQWWLLLLVPIIIICLIGIIGWLILRFILKTLSPRLDVQQRHATKEFVTKLQLTTETIQTPYPVILFYVLRDIVMRRHTGYLNDVAQRSKTLRPDFEDLRKLF